MRHFWLAPAAAIVALSATSLAAQQPVRHFQLTTQFLEAKKRCLEGSNLDGSGGGTAFMDVCKVVGGQLWRAEPTGKPGVFRLKVSWMDKCLEGSFPNSPVGGGGAYMDICQPVTGQEWRLVAAGGGYYKLVSEFGQRCLEGNAPGGIIGGAAFLDKCSGAIGQNWRLHGARIVNGIPVGSL